VPAGSPAYWDSGARWRNHVFKLWQTRGLSREGQDGMTEATPKSDPGRDEAKARVQRVYLLIEITVGVVLIGTILWFSQNYQPRTALGRGLVDLRLWLLVLLASGGGTAASLIPYYVGQRGTEVVFEHYPRLEPVGRVYPCPLGHPGPGCGAAHRRRCFQHQAARLSRLVFPGASAALLGGDVCCSLQPATRRVSLWTRRVP
jgi:hypothetical protein